MRTGDLAVQLQHGVEICAALVENAFAGRRATGERSAKHAGVNGRVAGALAVSCDMFASRPCGPSTFVMSLCQRDLRGLGGKRLRGAVPLGSAKHWRKLGVSLVSGMIRGVM